MTSLRFAGLNPIGGGNLLPSDWMYVGEASVADAHDANLVLLQCDLFVGNYWRFCFHYVSINVHGATEIMARLCLPAKDSGSAKYWASIPQHSFSFVGTLLYWLPVCSRNIILQYIVSG